MINKDDLILNYSEEELRQFVRFTRVCGIEDIRELAQDALAYCKYVKSLELEIESLLEKTECPLMKEHSRK